MTFSVTGFQSRLPDVLYVFGMETLFSDAVKMLRSDFVVPFIPSLCWFFLTNECFLSHKLILWYFQLCHYRNSNTSSLPKIQYNCVSTSPRQTMTSVLHSTRSIINMTNLKVHSVSLTKNSSGFNNQVSQVNRDWACINPPFADLNAACLGLINTSINPWHFDQNCGLSKDAPIR